MSATVQRSHVASPPGHLTCVVGGDWHHLSGWDEGVAKSGGRQGARGCGSQVGRRMAPEMGLGEGWKGGGWRWGGGGGGGEMDSRAGEAWTDQSWSVALKGVGRGRVEWRGHSGVQAGTSACGISGDPQRFRRQTERPEWFLSSPGLCSS